MDSNYTHDNQPHQLRPRVAYTLRETAILLGISERSVRRLVSRNLLRPSKALRVLIFGDEEIRRFLRDTTTK